MARQLNTDAQIDFFITKVIQDANHHAPDVEEIITPLSQTVRARLDLKVDSVSVWERQGNMGRTCWVEIGGNRWAFSYSHRTRKIELRQGSTQGEVVFEFENSTTAAQISEQAARL